MRSVKRKKTAPIGQSFLSFSWLQLVDMFRTYKAKNPIALLSLTSMI